MKTKKQAVDFTLVTIFICFCFGFFAISATSPALEKKAAAKNKMAKTFGFGRTATAGITTPGYADCGDDIIVFVVSSTDEIATGTAVYGNPSCTTPVPNTIIVAKTGPNAGIAFYVVNGVVGAQAEPC